MAAHRDTTAAGERRTRAGALFEAARAGDQQQLNRLVTELSPFLWQVARSQGLSQVSSEDVVQLTWLGLLRDMDRIREPAAVVGWLITTTKREAWRAVHRAKHELPATEDDPEELVEQAPTPEDEVLATDRRRRLWAAVNRLSARCRELLRVVAFVPRPDYTALAATLGMPKGGIGPTRQRCLAKLRALLDAEPEGGWS
jgi:RNA polymerase sigma factor (sigma-70 family)